MFLLGGVGGKQNLLQKLYKAQRKFSNFNLWFRLSNSLISFIRPLHDIFLEQLSGTEVIFAVNVIAMAVLDFAISNAATLFDQIF